MTLRVFLIAFLIFTRSSIGEEEAIFLSECTGVSPIFMKGLLLADGEHSIDVDKLETVCGLQVDENLRLPGTLQDLKKKIEPLFLNQQLDKEHLLLAKQEILKYFNVSHHRLIAIEIPEQDITAGTVVFVVREPTIDKVTYQKASRQSVQTRVEKQLALCPRTSLNTDELLDRLAWLNQNPFHESRVILSAGSRKGCTEVEVLTKDRLPLRFYAGGENTGLESTGNSRYYAGITWGNAFLVDDLLTYQFLSNDEYDRYHAHLLNYTSYLPWKHILMIYGGYTKIEPDISSFSSTGKEAQASLRYKIPFKPLYTPFRHQFYFGMDYKYITNDLLFVSEVSSTSLLNGQANVMQEMVGYFLEFTSCPHQCTCRAEIFGSPVKWLPHQNNEAYSSLRPDAKPRYIYGTVTVGEIYTFSSREEIAGLFRAQATPNTLIPSEQFKLGGYNSVRGYEESVFISDNGICLNVELRSRPISFFKKLEDELRLLAFMDYGWGYNYHPFNGITKTAILWGTGPGLRYNINPYLNVRVDYGFKLHHVTFDDNDLGMWHAGATLSY